MLLDRFRAMLEASLELPPGYPASAARPLHSEACRRSRLANAQKDETASRVIERCSEREIGLPTMVNQCPARDHACANDGASRQPPVNGGPWHDRNICLHEQAAEDVQRGDQGDLVPS